MAAPAILIAGLALVAAGTAAATARPTRWMAAPTALAGVVWLTPLWVEGSGSPAVVRSVAMVAAPFIVPLLGHLLLGQPGGHMAAGRRRLLVALYAAATVVAAVRGLLFDPFLDLGCSVACPDNAFLLVSDPQLTRTVGLLQLWFLLVGAGAVAALGTRSFWTATAAGRSAIGPVALPAAVAAACEAAHAAAVLLAQPADAAPTGSVAILFSAEAGSLFALGLGVGWTVLREHRRRLVLARLAEQLAAQPTSLRTTLARSLGDDGLLVAYRLPDARGYVDASGRPFAPDLDRGQITTHITRRGEPVAMVVHDSALGPRLEQEMGSAVRLGIDNERLRSALLWELENLRASRARIVEAADETRRRLERDLHDGAQQRLLAVAFQLHLALTDARTSGDESLATAVAALVEDAHEALGELRELAHGIFPTILDQSGLDAALSMLADDADIPVEVSQALNCRLPADVERTAYLVANAAVETAARQRVDRLRLVVERRDSRLILQADGVGWEEHVHLTDRVGALGGTLSTTRQGLRVEIPCA